MITENPKSSHGRLRDFHVLKTSEYFKKKKKNYVAYKICFSKAFEKTVLKAGLEDFTFGSLKQEDCNKFPASLNCTLNGKPIWLQCEILC